jgi:hypothetical protein
LLLVDIWPASFRLHFIIDINALHRTCVSGSNKGAFILLLPACAALLKKLKPEVRQSVEEHRQRQEGQINGWHASARFFAPQKKSPQMSEEIVEEQRCVIL